MQQIDRVETEQQWQDAHALLAAYAEVLPSFTLADGVCPCFDDIGEELSQLPWEYVEDQRGALLLASRDDGPGREVVGLVALREFAPNAGELRRLFVRPEFRSQGIGRALLMEAMGQAQDFGFRFVLLNVLPSMYHARQLFHDFGFYAIEPYDRDDEGVLYLCLDLLAEEASANADPSDTLQSEPSVTSN